MHFTLTAAIATVACLLSACGFVPPAPPAPPDTGRILINHADPRTLLPGKTATALASAQALEVPIPAAPPPNERPAPPTETSSQQSIRPTTSTEATASAAPPTEAPPIPATNEVTAPATDVTASTHSAASGADAVLTVEIPPAESAVPAEAVDPPKKFWRVSPEDGTVRQALVRWASEANWTFGPDQWELNFDIPIQAPAEFEGDSFREATQALSQAVAMGESPIRPCFYGNRVLRMVPITRSCNRSPATQS